jgi:hypothetical protein
MAGSKLTEADCADATVDARSNASTVEKAFNMVVFLCRLFKPAHHTTRPAQLIHGLCSSPRNALPPIKQTTKRAKRTASNPFRKQSVFLIGKPILKRLSAAALDFSGSATRSN